LLQSKLSRTTHKQVKMVWHQNIAANGDIALPRANRKVTK